MLILKQTKKNRSNTLGGKTEFLFEDDRWKYILRSKCNKRQGKTLKYRQNIHVTCKEQR